MKSVRLITLIFPAILLLFSQGCNNASKDADLIRKLDAQWVDASNAKDIDKVMNLMAPDVVYMIQESPVLKGSDAVRKQGEKWISEYPDALPSEDKIDTVIIAGNYAIDWGSSKQPVKTGSGQFEATGNWINIWKKSGGEWKAVFVMGLSDKPMKEILAPVATVEAFTRLENDWSAAVFNKDAKALDLIYATEYTYIDPEGKVYNKQQDINDVISDNYKPLSVSVVSDIKVSLYGSIAVVNGLSTVNALYNGKKINGTYRFTDVFEMRDDRWQCVNTQSSGPVKK